MSEDLKIELTFKDLELTQINIQPGAILAVTVKSDDIDGETIQQLNQGLSKAFPNNKVLVIGLALSDEIRFSAISEIKENSACTPTNFCVDCNCGKKEAYDNNS